MQPTVPSFIIEQGSQLDPLNRVADVVWGSQAAFIRWPQKDLLFAEGFTRHHDGKRSDCYDYNSAQKNQLAEAGLSEDRRNNGPAILAFLLAKGDRPRRQDFARHHWPVHHIYDGKFPALRKRSALHAIKDGNHFTRAAGLVALHPLAHQLAGECGYFAWWLRHEAFLRFAYDPMNVFSST